MILSEVPDTDIIRRVLQGDSSAFGVLVDRYQQYVFTLTLRMIENRQDAEEVSQDVFIKAYRSLADFRGESKFSTWLFTITRTRSISFLRKRRPDIQSLNLERTQRQLQNSISGFAADRVELKSRHAMLHEAITGLSPEDRQVLNLFYSGEQSLAEIGKIMGLETTTIKVKLFRARQRLKEKMEKVFPEEVQDL